MCNLATMQSASIDHRSFAVNDAARFPCRAVALASVVMLISTAALGSCHTTLRGELVQHDNPKYYFPAVPQKLLFFSLEEITEENGTKMGKVLQSFSFTNDKTTFPLPFALDISSPGECPKELDLWVSGSDHRGFHHEYPLNGFKKIRLDESEFVSVAVYPPRF